MSRFLGIVANRAARHLRLETFGNNIGFMASECPE
jgi:hypothetical protein